MASKCAYNKSIHSARVHVIHTLSNVILSVKEVPTHYDLNVLFPVNPVTCTCTSLCMYTLVLYMYIVSTHAHVVHVIHVCVPCDIEQCVCLLGNYTCACTFFIFKAFHIMHIAPVLK